ncbi:MAG: hypothetical protein NZ821_02270, partial [Gloeomargarita sp. SKYB31]|nr:hypothetical protein [Gloeomargarita sp. SKYB31]
KHGQKIGLGGVVPGAFQYISLPSLEPIGYLQRLNQTLRIYALSSGLMYNDSEITRYVSIPKKYGFVKLNAGGKDIQVTF